jgi:hypothetical protein
MIVGLGGGNLANQEGGMTPLFSGRDGWETDNRWH